MRTSHRAVLRRIREVKPTLSDEQLFSSSAYAAYLTDQAQLIAKRYKRPVRVVTEWNPDPRAYLAYTDNRTVHINTGNAVSRSFPSRLLHAQSILGLLGHELGHILYTDFTALGLYLSSIGAGKLYPCEPVRRTDLEEDNWQEFLRLFADQEEAALATLKIAAGNLSNILEDVYIEERTCSAYLGTIRTGILLNAERITERIPTIQKQIEQEYEPYAIMCNLILQYCRTGDVNNAEGYRGEYLDALLECIPFIDDAVYDTDVKVRLKATNQLLLRLWQYIKPMIEDVRRQMDAKKELDEVLKGLKDKLAAEAPGSAMPKGKGHASSASKESYLPDPSAFKTGMKGVQEVIEEEGGRIAPHKTSGIDEGGAGGVTYDRKFPGSGYAAAADDVERILTKVAVEKAEILVNEELEDALQKAAGGIQYGNLHKGVPVTVHRMSAVSDDLVREYHKIAPPLLQLSKQMQRQIRQILKDRRDGGKQTGLYYGKQLDAHALSRMDGRLFYNTRLPSDGSEVAVALLVDESGSMSCGDRASYARASAIALYDFCKGLGFPVAVYGHTEDFGDGHVDLFAYAEFDSPDRKDQYRLMDICARENNRDGAALQFTAERLLTRNEWTKLLIVISDGQPAGRGYSGSAAEADLHSIKKKYEREGITLFAAAIGDDKPNIERIYGDGYLDISDLAKLPRMLTRLISQYVK